MKTIVAARGWTFANRNAAADRLITVSAQTSARPQRCSSIPVTVVDTRRATVNPGSRSRRARLRSAIPRARHVLT